MEQASPTDHQIDVCDRYWSTRANYTIYFLVDAYDGLPECLLVNILLMLVGLLAFSILRKQAWEVSRFELVSRMEERNLVEKSSRYNVWTSIFYGEKQKDEMDPKVSLDSMSYHDSQSGFCSWIPAIFRIKDEKILQKCGQDALQYLIFQKYLIVYMLVTVGVCIFIILPLNYTQGDLEGDWKKFGRTTITNIDPQSNILWIHCSLGICLLAVALVFMRHFNDNVHYKLDKITCETLMISNIPVAQCFNHVIAQHFQEAYPECPVQDIQFAYNISQLISYENSRQSAVEALVMLENSERKTGERATMMPYTCGALCCSKCCMSCGAKEVDAVDYYTVQAARYKELVDVEKVNAFHDKLGIGFVTFEDPVMTARVYHDFRWTCKGPHNPMSSSIGREIQMNNWEVTLAPSPDDIYWENLSVSPGFWWMRAFFVNLLVVVILCFLTTPSIVLSDLNKIRGFTSLTGESGESTFIVFRLIPCLLLLLMSCLLPVLVSVTDTFMVGHWTKSALNHTIMRKVYIYVLIMVLILPSLGFSSIDRTIEWYISSSRNSTFHWNCMFVSSNCAFFVNYMMSASTIGIAVDFLRVPNLLLYLALLVLAKSKAERSVVRKNVVTEFAYGGWYAWILCNFTVTMAYSITSPLITIPGLFYHVAKYYTDRYNIYYVYRPSKIDANIHETAINFVIVALFVLQLTLFSFIILRANEVVGINVFAVVCLSLTLVVFCGRICFARFRPVKKFRPEDYQQMPRDSSIFQSRKRVSFVPELLIDADEAGGVRPAFLPGALPANYGSQGNIIRQSYKEDRWLADDDDPSQLQEMQSSKSDIGRRSSGNRV